MTPYFAFVALLLSHEIIDTRELRVWPDDLLARIKLCANLPHMECVHLFPIPRSQINEMLILNRANRQWLEMMRELHGERFSVWLEVNKELYDVYDYLRDAMCPYYYVHIRRQALGKLLDKIGYDDFMAGRLPPVIPR